MWRGFCSALLDSSALSWGCDHIFAFPRKRVRRARGGQFHQIWPCACRLWSREEGERKVLRRQLTRRFGERPAWAAERLDAASAVELEAWAEEILDAGSLEELFVRSG
ncbi:DUF4351 domain-containing protein [Haliea sp. E1-2-M8]|uniref:DUF4351 domain-containing protein n=1 Tax=Haliea sp. E1-2-M8 TaxID=3064706 RepID=UPI00351BF5E6